MLWKSIVKNFNMRTAIVKRKIISLLGSFRAHWTKSKKIIGTGKSLFEKLHMGYIKTLIGTLIVSLYFVVIFKIMCFEK